MPAFKILLETHKCIGCTTCAALAPDFFEMQGSKAHLKNVQHSEQEEELEAHLGAGQEAACRQSDDACPVNCIHVQRKEG